MDKVTELVKAEQTAARQIAKWLNEEALSLTEGNVRLWFRAKFRQVPPDRIVRRVMLMAKEVSNEVSLR